MMTRNLVFGFASLLVTGVFAWPQERPRIIVRFDPVSTDSISCDAPTFDYDGSSWKFSRTWTTNAMPVRGGAYIRADLAWRKLAWNFGSFFNVRLRFEDARGKEVLQHDIDSTRIPAATYSMVEADGPIALNERIDYYNFFQVPTNAVAMRAGVSFRGNPCKVRVEELTFQYVDEKDRPWYSQPPLGHQIAFEPPTVTDAELEAHLKARPVAVPKLVRNGDRLELFVNGEQIRPAFRHCQRTHEELGRGHKHGIREFKKAGYRVYNVNVVFGEHTYADPQPQVWREDGSLDIGLLEKKAYKALREDPDGYVIIVCKVSAPRFWKMANLHELERNLRGEYRIFNGTEFTADYSTVYPDKPGFGWVPSLFSEKYLADVGKALEEAFRRFEKTPAGRAVIGVYITGGDDCQFRMQRDPWNSANAQEGFRKWLRQEYGSDAGLAQAWRQPDARIDGVVIPNEDELNPPRQFNNPDGRGRESDFRRYSSFANYRSHAAMRSGVKRGAPRFLVGGYNGAISFSGNEGRGRHMLEKVLADPGYDFTIWLPEYSRRRNDVVMPLGLFAYNGSALLHGKLTVTELDTRNPLQPDMWYGMYPMRLWQHQHDYRTFESFLNFATGCAMAWGGAWHQYTLNWHWYHTREAMRIIGGAGAIADQAEARPYSRARFAMFFDERTSDFCSRSKTGNQIEKPNLFSWPAVDAVWQTGVRFDNYLIDDALHPDFAREAPKVLCFANAATMKAETIRSIRERYLRDGRVIVWMGTPGGLSGESEEAVSSALGIGVRKTYDERPISTVGADRLVAGVKGFWNGNCYRRSLVFGLSYELQPGKEWVPLAHYSGTDRCGAAVRRQGNATEIVIGSTGAARADLFRNVAREAGIRPCVETDDNFVTGASLAMVGACSGGGVKRIWYPDGVRKMVPLTGQKPVAEGDGYVDIYMAYRDTAVFKLEY